MADYRRTSRLAIAAILCIVGAVACIVPFLLATLVHLHQVARFFVACILLLSVLAFLLGIVAVVVTHIWREKLKGSPYALAAILLSSPVIFALHKAAYVKRINKERERTNTGKYNLRLLGKALAEYSKDHQGYLPPADQWCDLLMQHNGQLAKDNFRHPKPDRHNLEGECHFAFNKNLGGMRLADVPADCVLIFEADGEWNLNGASELLPTRLKAETGSIAMLCADQTIGRYWYYMRGVRKFDSKGTRMYHDKPRWKP